MIVTVSGTVGSGKSTVAKMIKEALGFERIYVGGIRRKIAKQKGMNVEELNAYAMTHNETDLEVDQQAAQEAKDLAAQGNNVLVEGRTQFHFLPESFKVFIKCDHKEAAKRIFAQMQEKDAVLKRNDGTAKTLAEMETQVLKRERLDQKRFLQYYNIDHLKESQYDLVVDSTAISADEVAKIIIKEIKELQKA